MWPFNYAPHLTSRILCVLRGYAFFVKVCSSRKPPVLHTFYNTWSKLHSSHRRAPTPFVSPVGNPPTDQDSNGIPCRVFRIFLLADRFISIRWCRYFGVSSLSLSCSKNLFIQIRGQSQPVPSRQISIFPTLFRRYIQGVASDVPIFSCLDRSSRKALFFFVRLALVLPFASRIGAFPNSVSMEFLPFLFLSVLDVIIFVFCFSKATQAISVHWLSFFLYN